MAEHATLAADGSLHVSWADGAMSTFHAVWLRDNCPCPECRHPSGQRLLDSQYGAQEIAEFEASPFAADAVRLRRYDDVRKEPGLATPGLEHYRPALEAALR